MSDWTDFLQGVSILLLAFACISNSLWIYQVNWYFRDQEKPRQLNRKTITSLRGADSEAKQANAHLHEQDRPRWLVEALSTCKTEASAMVIPRAYDELQAIEEFPGRTYRQRSQEC